MAHDSSSGAVGAQAFNLNSQSGVLAVLTAARNSSLSSAAKNELRDLVFLYTNGGGDSSVRLALEQKLDEYQLPPAAPQPRQGHRLPAQRFSVRMPPVTRRKTRVQIPTLRPIQRTSPRARTLTAHRPRRLSRLSKQRHVSRILLPVLMTLSAEISHPAPRPLRLLKLILKIRIRLRLILRPRTRPKLRMRARTRKAPMRVRTAARAANRQMADIVHSDECGPLPHLR